MPIVVVCAHHRSASRFASCSVSCAASMLSPYQTSSLPSTTTLLLRSVVVLDTVYMGRKYDATDIAVCIFSNVSQLICKLDIYTNLSMECRVARRTRYLMCVAQGDQMLCSTSRGVSVLCGSGRPDVV